MWPLIIAGFLANQITEKGASDRRNRISRSMEAYQKGQAQKSTAAINALLAKSGPAQRQQEMRAIEGERAGAMRDVVEDVSQFAPVPIAGKPSEDRTRATAAAAQSVAERTRRAIEQLSRMGAPGEAQQASARRFGLAAGDVDAANRAIQSVGSGYMTDISNVQANPWLKMGGQIALGAGMGGLAGAGVAGMAARPRNRLAPTVWGSSPEF